MSKNEKRIIFVAAIILVVFSVIAFVAPFTKTAVFWISYIFGVIAILLQLLAVRVAFKKGSSVKSKFYGFPIIRISLAYMVVQVLLSIVFMIIATIAPTWVPVIAYVLILASGLIGFVAADATRDEIERQDTVLKADTGCIQNLRSIVYALPARIDDAECVKALKALADEFRYSDPVSSDATKNADDELAVLVNELQKAVVDANVENIKTLCRNTSVALGERNRVCKVSK